MAVTLALILILPLALTPSPKLDRYQAAQLDLVT